MEISKNYIESAQLVAETFLATISESVHLSMPDDPYSYPAEIEQCTQVFWWDDNTPLFEFPFTDNLGRLGAGYVIVAIDRKLPPIHEYCFSGPPLSAQLSLYLNTVLLNSGINSQDRKYYYWSGCEITARLRGLKNEKYSFIQFPDLKLIHTDNKIKIKRSPSRKWSKKFRDDAWEKLKGNRKKDLVAQLTLPHKPIKYSQSCSAYLTAPLMCELSMEAGSSCSPACIAGCTPVAWAMLASAYRTAYDRFPSIFPAELGRIYSTAEPNDPSKTWKTNWGSTKSQSSIKSDVVNQEIWSFHNAMRTDCNGNTQIGGNGNHAYRNVLHRPAAHLNARWGLHQYYFSFSIKDTTIPSYSTMMGRNHPLVLHGMSQWGIFLEQKKPELSDEEGMAGHSVVAYGVSETNQTILISLGWGSYFSDKWILLSGVRPFASTASNKYA